MALQDVIAQDQIDVQSAQATLDVANAKLSADQALLDAAAPHLSVLAELEIEVTKLSGELQSGFSILIAKARSLF
ncbi:hypothetical protein [Glaciimonas immobilis]|uniref:Uncharacterized protein n=1 Tax=Glaciimonas immobilis TaxID=728004 RepID=A0A840RV64_9BURK|nr:hypothetical protein [Glaciimonas immobilis]KAF3997538.1 hypothetical protein HAV38_12735 [Glaciimonas immobilis]MBB5200776.1 hypothetical protein [Glaciimonas immobilis]